MKRQISCAMILLTSLLQGESTLRIAPDPGNELHLYVEKTGAMSGKKHDFVFTDYSGEIQPETSVHFTLKSASIVSKDTWVSPGDTKKVMKAALQDMLAVDRYPVIEFRSTSIKKISANEFDVPGTLTIRDKTRDVIVHVKQPAPMTYEGTSKFKLTDFGLKPPSAAFGIVGTKDEMTFVFLLKAREK
jgi:polyisoprenoid-binding protein YceI